MKLPFLPQAIVILMGALCVPVVSYAHSAWVAKNHGALTVMYGEEESDTDTYDPKRVINVRALKNGQSDTIKTQTHEQGYLTFEAPAPGVIGFTLDNGVWIKTREGKWLNQAKDSFANPAEIELSMRVFKHSVNYLDPQEPVKALGYELEIVPEANPAAIKPGGKLAVRVLYHGKPLAGAKLESNDHGSRIKATTDKSGRVKLTVHRGFNMLNVSHSVPHDTPDQADKTSQTATLTFTAAHSHEQD